ncbi:MAG: prephenate dehydratase [Gomphosphaeria aponina SAG 52.96 = DSM 107014]|uniref:Prephenate dehydratase n=1 Tax=Gomphosphaeria aponina SAG 52.96 = DSM 107014 TaxID=1521640 RepID=A0A941JUV4_9CHRO|nr:prephenate dehydratase [Gomphosphaeria aponina SAG 52.96 = DSM 107014]
MAISIAHLGPVGTYTETAALAYGSLITKKQGEAYGLCPCSSIAATLRSVAEGNTDLAVVPVENSIEGSVAITLDTLWELENLQIQQALVLPIAHVLLSQASSLKEVQIVYSHPQAIGQCQKWREQFLPNVQLIPTNSTTEALEHLKVELKSAAIASLRASQLYNLPVLAVNLNDYPDNCTRFWVLGLKKATSGSHISLAFSVPANVPGSLVKPLQVFAQRGINLSRIESRPTKRSLGDYLFFIDLEACYQDSSTQAALAELETHTALLKIFGNYNILPIP